MDALKEQQQLRIRLEQVRLLFEPSRYVAFGYVVIAMMTAIIQWPVIEHRLILLWSLAIGLMVAGRLWLAFAFEREQPQWFDVARWERYFLVGTLGAGLSWGGRGVASLSGRGYCTSGGDCDCHCRHVCRRLCDTIRSKSPCGCL